MSGIGGVGRAITRIVIAVLVLGVILLAAGCGMDGKIYGSVDWDYTRDWASIEGFPVSGYSNTYYEINPGTYNVYYTLVDDSGNYYPGIYYGNDPSYYWQATYSVQADKGSFPMVDGMDRYFDLYLGWDGLYKYGAVSAIETPAQGSGTKAPRLGTQSWTANGLLITVTNNIVKLTPEEIAKLSKTQMKKR
jgi:hypothetical protein